MRTARRRVACPGRLSLARVRDTDSSIPRTWKRLPGLSSSPEVLQACFGSAPTYSLSGRSVWRMFGIARLSRRDFAKLLHRPRKLGALDGFFAALLRQSAERSELVDQALHVFRENGLSIAECAKSVGVSERRLSQVFREHVGIAPKMWCRVRRFQTAARALHEGADVPWVELALACGYNDQSHFANDFRAFSGVDPTTYCTRRGTWQNHISVH